METYRKITRIEKYLAKIIGEDVELPESPIYREEFYLAKIAGETVNVLPTPITRIDFYLAKIAGESVELPTPITKTDYLLAKVAGEDVETPEYPLSEAEKYLLEWAEGGGYEETTVTGVSPLVLANAAARAIVSLTQYGKCEQATTPTPDAPVDIVCNNGTLKMKHRSGLPDGYRLLEYVGGSGSQYVITDLYLASTDVIECEFRNSTTTGYGAVYGIFKNGESSALYGNQTYYGYDQSNNKVDTDVHVDTDWHSSRHDFVNGTLTIDDTTVTFTPFEFVNSTKNAVLSRYYNNNYGYNWKGFIRKFKVTRNGEVVCNLLPAKNSNNEAGLYDLVTGDFYTATGGTLIEGNEVDDYELAIVGTPETINITASGADTQTATAPNIFAVANYADEVKIISGAVKRRVGIKVFDGTESFGKSSAYGAAFYIQSASGAWGPQKARVMCSHYLGLDSASSSTAVDTCFFNASGHFYFRVADNSDTAAFKAWLAAQYAAGTPVIVIYPLAEETTESVTAQPLSTNDGDNTITVTANCDNIQFEITYDKKKGA